ncbi:PSP1 domain-containing protein, partial [Bacillus thuringiensis]|uniref:PSP1 domain-containing protein n=1 Tax=Bacillus thuringiensis TaxID=1428 RepID=UPI0021B5B2FE
MPIPNQNHRTILQHNKHPPKQPYQLCHQNVVQHNLHIKLLHLHYTFHPNNIIFYFTPHPPIHFPQ